MIVGTEGIAYKDAQMRAFVPAPRRIRAPKPGL